jgi:hypothetical protein
LQIALLFFLLHSSDQIRPLGHLQFFTSLILADG